MRRALSEMLPGDFLRVFAAGQTGALVGTVVAESATQQTDAALLVEAQAVVVAAIGAGRVNPAALAVWLIRSSAELPLQAGQAVQV